MTRDLSETLDAVCLATRIVLENGGETYRAEQTVERMCKGFGIPKAEVLALPTGVMLTVHVDDETEYTRIVRVSSRTIDLTRLDDCNTVSRLAAEKKLSAQEALTRLR